MVGEMVTRNDLIVLNRGRDFTFRRDELGWAKSAGSLEDTVRAARRKVVAACNHSMPRCGHGRTRDLMYWWNDQLSVLRRECLSARRRFTRSKGDLLLREVWEIAKSALRQGIKKS